MSTIANYPPCTYMQNAVEDLRVALQRYQSQVPRDSRALEEMLLDCAQVPESVFSTVVKTYWEVLDGIHITCPQVDRDEPWVGMEGLDALTRITLAALAEHYLSAAEHSDPTLSAFQGSGLGPALKALVDLALEEDFKENCDLYQLEVEAVFLEIAVERFAFRAATFAKEAMMAVRSRARTPSIGSSSP